MSRTTDTDAMRRELSMEYNTAFGEVIQRKRKRAGMTQEQLGNCLGVNKSTISRYENGSIDIPAAALPMSCEACDFKMTEYVDAANDIVTEQRLKQICAVRQMETDETDRRQDESVPGEATPDENAEHYTDEEQQLAKVSCDYICRLKNENAGSDTLNDFIDIFIETVTRNTGENERYKHLALYIERFMSMKDQVRINEDQHISNAAKENAKYEWD